MLTSFSELRVKSQPPHKNDFVKEQKIATILHSSQMRQLSTRRTTMVRNSKQTALNRLKEDIRNYSKQGYRVNKRLPIIDYNSVEIQRPKTFQTIKMRDVKFPLTERLGRIEVISGRSTPRSESTTIPFYCSRFFTKRINQEAKLSIIKGMSLHYKEDFKDVENELDKIKSDTKSLLYEEKCSLDICHTLDGLSADRENKFRKKHYLRGLVQSIAQQQNTDDNRLFDSNIVKNGVKIETVVRFDKEQDEKELLFLNEIHNVLSHKYSIRNGRGHSVNNPTHVVQSRSTQISGFRSTLDSLRETLSHSIPKAPFLKEQNQEVSRNLNINDIYRGCCFGLNKMFVQSDTFKKLDGFLKRNFEMIKSLIFEFSFASKQNQFWGLLLELSMTKLDYIVIKTDHLSPNCISFLEKHAKEVIIKSIYIGYIKLFESYDTNRLMDYLIKIAGELVNLTFESCYFAGEQLYHISNLLFYTEKLESLQLIGFNFTTKEEILIYNLWQHDNLRLLCIENSAFINPSKVCFTLSDLFRNENLRFISLKGCDLQLEALEPFLDKFLMYETGKIKSVDISNNIFDINHLLNSKYGSLLTEIKTLERSSLDLRYLYSRWDESIFAMFYLQETLRTSHSKATSNLMIKVVLGQKPTDEIVLYKESPNSTINPGGVSLYNECPSLQRWKKIIINMK